MSELVTQIELADILGVSQPYIAKLVKQGIFDNCFEGKKLKKDCALETYYRFKQTRRTKRSSKNKKIIKELVQNGEELGFNLKDMLEMLDNPVDRVALYKDYWAAKVNEIKYEKERGKYYLKEEIDKKAEKILTAFKNKTLALPNKVAPALVGLNDLSEIKTILDNAVYELLDELSRLEDVTKENDELG